MKDIVLVGSGGFAKEVKWLIEENNKVENKWNILGFVSEENIGELVDGLPILGDDDWLIHYNHPLDVVICIGNGKVRKKIADRYSVNKNLEFPTIIAQTARIGNSVSIGKGGIITEYCVLTTDIKIGDFFLCNLSVTIGHDCEIGNYVTLFPGCHVSGNVKLGESVSIGTGANVLQGISIGDYSFLGAGGVATKNIPENVIAVGVPAKIKGEKSE